MQLAFLKRELLGAIGREKEAIGRVNALEAFGEEANQAELTRWRGEIKVWKRRKKEWKKRNDALEESIGNGNAKAQKTMERIWSADGEE